MGDYTNINQLTTPQSAGYPAGTFWARWPARCGSCHEMIYINVAARFAGDDEVIVHAHCPDPHSEAGPGRTERKCSDCFMIHSGECF